MLVIIDYGLGNLGSLLNMCKHIGIDASISNKERDILSASHVILPGVGSFDIGMKKLKETGMVDVLNEKVLILQQPILGICLGMQLMTDRSDEGIEPGLGWINADTKKLPDVTDLKVPHMGWNRLLVKNKSCRFMSNLENSRYYFVHSYYVKCKDRKDVIAQACHGLSFDAAFQKKNIYGVQFHPEKSHKFGVELLKNFSKIED